MMKKNSVFILLLYSFNLFCQSYQSIKYQFPIKSGQQNYLSGTFGEIRNAHFHTGIDIKTENRIGLPVYATADGYISRIKISTTGYGAVLYMRHPNNTYSIYAHLADFDPKIVSWVIKEQYRKESFTIDLYPDEGQFKFQQGNIIGYSGNTGSSKGPHLHFEIRDSLNQPFDPLSVIFYEIKDNLAPVTKKIAFITLHETSRINGFFGRYEFDLIKIKNGYQTKEPIHLKGKIGIELYSYDRMNGVSNKNGIVKTSLQLDGNMLFLEDKSVLNFNKQQNTLIHYNYLALKKGRNKFNKLYLSDGNEHTIYSTINRGIDFRDQNEILIQTEDSYKNKSITKIVLSDEAIKTRPKLHNIEQIGNYLHFTSKDPSFVLLDKWMSVNSYYSIDDTEFYLWDLRKGTPKTIFVNTKNVSTNMVGIIPSNQNITYSQPDFTMDLTRRSLFDTLYLAFEKKIDLITNKELFNFNETHPIRSNIYLTLNTAKDYDKKKAAVYSVNRNNFSYMGGTWKNDKQIEFSTKNLTTYTILEDTISPTIEILTINSTDLEFKIDDKLSGIKRISATIDGEFVLMEYEPKKKVIKSQKLNENIPFRGEFILKIVDNMNNETIYRKKL